MTRDVRADERDTEASADDENARRRDQRARVRDEAADSRDEDHARDGTDSTGASADRDRAADRRDREADERDQAAERSESTGSWHAGADLLRAGRDRREAASDRRQSGRDRAAAAAERTEAGLDRDRASADRATSLQDRQAASLDALTDARWNAAFETAPVGVLEMDLEGRILRANLEMGRLLEYPCAELVGTLVADHSVPDEREAAAARVTAMAQGSSVLDGVTRHFRTGTGGDCWIYGSGVRIAGVDGQPDRILGYLVDITGERRHRLRLAQANAQFAALLEHSTNAILVLERVGGNVMYASPGLTAITGADPESVIGASFRTFVHPDDRVATYAAVERIVAEPGRPGTIECRIRHTDGRWRTVETTVVNLIDDPAVGGVVADLRDITDRVAAEIERHELEDRLRHSERLESVGQLAGGIAHDFNNLLGVILNYAEFVIEQTEAMPQVQADAAQIQAAAERAAALTRQLLIFARRETIQLVPVDLDVVVANIENLLLRSLGEQITLVVRAGTDVPTIRADVGQIEQVLVNLAVNARDAMGPGGTLTIETGRADLDAEYSRAHPDADPGCYAMLSVSDTGTGMSPELCARIFEPFFTTKPQGQGTGPGLATLYGIVRAAQGSVYVYSEEGIGTTFRVYLPASEAEVAGASPDASVADDAGHGEAILVVEDEPALLEVTARMLRRSGYDVSVAPSPEEALRLVAARSFRLLLTDVVMPGASGRDLAEQVLARRPDIAVVYMSGYSAGVLGPRLLLDDHVALIQKPFSQAALVAKVHEALGRAAVGSAERAS